MDPLPLGEQGMGPVKMEDTEMKDETPGEAPKGTRISTSGWTLENILARGSNFRQIPTVDITSLQTAEIERLVQKHENSGVPLLMTGFHRRKSWDSRMFSPQWLRDVEGASRLMVRNVYDRKDRESSTLKYLEYAESASHYALVDESKRLYAKDAPCPEEWHQWMVKYLPGYMLPFGPGDVSSYMPLEANKFQSRVETLMTYLGIGDTYTPAHKDSCASVGQNLMVHTGNNASSFWFLTSTGDSYKASMYWRELGQELDLESHVATVDELAKANFPIYVCQQELGGFVVVPPRSCHQVLNSGGLTMKMSWSRMISKSYTLSLCQELRIYQRVCRPEVYRVKATVAAVVSACSEILHTQGRDKGNDPEYLSRLNHFMPLYKQMLIESYDPHWKMYEMRSLEACDCCGADIWQSAMICTHCSPEVDGVPNDARTPLVICGSCYVDGRSCKCESMKPAQARPFDELMKLANKAIILLDSNQENDRNGVVEPLSEQNLTSTVHPPVFRVATFLHRYRMSTKGSGLKSCNLYRSKKNRPPDERNHIIKVHQGMVCSGCHSRACWYHIAEKYNVHIITIATFSEVYQALQRGKNPPVNARSFMSDAWHRFHAVDRSTSSSHIPFGKPYMDWLPRLASLFRSNRPLNESVLLGWYDGAHLGICDEINNPGVTLALPSNSSPERPPPSQLTSLPFPSSTIAAIIPLKRKAPNTPTIDSPSRRKRRMVHYAEEDESSVDELAILPARNDSRYATRNTSLEVRVRQLEEQVERLKAEREEDIANFQSMIARLQSRLPVDEEIAAENIDGKQTTSSESAASLSGGSVFP